MSRRMSKRLNCLFLLFQLSGARMNAPQCKDSSRQLFGQTFSSSYVNYEIPIDTRSASLDSMYFICPDFATKQRYSWLLGGVFGMGDFLPDYCAPGCAHSVSFGMDIPCGIRRPPMTWGPSTDLVDTTNCDDLNIPMANESYYQLSVIGIGGSISNASLNYLITKPWRGIQILTTFASKAQAQAIEYLLDNIPTIQELYVTAPRTSFVDPDLSFIWKIISMKPWKVISFDMVKFPVDVEFNVSQLRALRLYLAGVKKVPDWLKEANKLEYLQIDNNNEATLSGLKNIQSLQQLEHLILPRCSLKSVNDLMMNNSKLLSLDISCNLLEKIPDDFFQGIPNVSFLTVSGNMFESLGPKIFSPLTNLLTLDIGRQVPVMQGFISKAVLMYINRVPIMQICRTTIDEDEPQLTEWHPNYLPNPEKLLVFEVTHQVSLNFTRDYFLPFKNLVALGLANLTLKNLAGLGIENLTELNWLKASGNVLDDEEWLPKEIVMNLHKLQALYLTNTYVRHVPGSLIALTKSQGMVAAQVLQDYPPGYSRYMEYCDYNILMNILDNDPLNETCSTQYKETLEEANAMVLAKYKNQEIAYPMTFL